MHSGWLGWFLALKFAPEMIDISSLMDKWIDQMNHPINQLLLGKLINKDESGGIKGARKVGGAKNQSRERCVTMTALCCVLSLV